MQRLKFFGNRQAAIEQVPDPVPPDDGVVMEIKASALCGTDLHSLYRSRKNRPARQGTNSLAPRWRLVTHPAFGREIA